jgi:hypothetical protein
MLMLDAISYTVICLFPKISCSTRQMFTLCTAVCWTLAHYGVPSPHCAFNLQRVSAGFTFPFTRNLMIQHCSALGVTRSDAILY